MKTDPNNTECIDPNRDDKERIRELLSQLRLTPDDGARAQGYGLTVIAEPWRFVDTDDVFSVTISVFNDDGLRVNLSEIDVVAAGREGGARQEGRHTDWGDIALDELPTSAEGYRLAVDRDVPRFKIRRPAYTRGLKAAASGAQAAGHNVPETVAVQLSDPNLIAQIRESENRGETLLMVQTKSPDYGQKNLILEIEGAEYPFSLAAGKFAFSAQVSLKMPFDAAREQLKGIVTIRVEGKAT